MKYLYSVLTIIPIFIFPLWSNSQTEIINKELKISYENNASDLNVIAEAKIPVLYDSIYETKKIQDSIISICYHYLDFLQPDKDSDINDYSLEDFIVSIDDDRCSFPDEISIDNEIILNTKRLLSLNISTSLIAGHCGNGVYHNTTTVNFDLKKQQFLSLDSLFTDIGIKIILEPFEKGYIDIAGEENQLYREDFLGWNIDKEYIIIYYEYRIMPSRPIVELYKVKLSKLNGNWRDKDISNYLKY